MADFGNPDPHTMNYQELAEKAKMLKETEGGEAKMCAITEQWFNDGKAEGRAEGYNAVAEEMIKKNMPASLISEITKLSVERLKEISNKIGVALVM